MEEQRRRFVHLVNVWYYDGNFYVSPSIVDHITWRAVNPTEKVAIGDVQELASALERAKNVSNYKGSELPESQIWDRIVGEGKNKGEVGNKATADWGIGWYEDGQVKITPMERGTQLKGVYSWVGKKGENVELPNTASFLEIAQILKV